MDNSFYNGSHHIYRDDDGMCMVFESNKSDNKTDFAACQTVMLYFNSLFRNIVSTDNPYTLFNNKNDLSYLIASIGRNKNIIIHGISDIKFFKDITNFIKQLRNINCYVVVTSRYINILKEYSEHVDATYLYDPMFLDKNFESKNITGYCITSINNQILKMDKKCFGYISMLDNLTFDEINNLPEHIICFEIAKSKRQIPMSIFNMQKYGSLNISERNVYLRDFDKQHNEIMPLKFEEEDMEVE